MGRASRCATRAPAWRSPGRTSQPLDVDGVEHLIDPATPDRLAACRDGGRAACSCCPGFDEFVLGYGDRSAVLDPEFADRIVPGGNGMFRPTVVHGGRIVGTWGWTGRGAKRAVTATPFTAFPDGVDGRIPSAAPAAVTLSRRAPGRAASRPPAAPVTQRRRGTPPPSAVSSVSVPGWYGFAPPGRRVAGALHERRVGGEPDAADVDAEDAAVRVQVDGYGTPTSGEGGRGLRRPPGRPAAASAEMWRPSSGRPT